MKTLKSKNIYITLLVAFLLQNASAQTVMPSPGIPKSVAIPAVKEEKLANGLTVAVVERKNVPLVTVQLLFRSGANLEDPGLAGLTNLTFSLLTKGTQKRTATEIANQLEFLGGSLNTGAGWNSSSVSVNVMSDKVDSALEIMSDVVLNPTFKQEEVDLLKAQTLDNLTYSLNQPGFLANYAASVYAFNEHPAGGTPESIKNISRQNIIDNYTAIGSPSNAVLIFTGDISPTRARQLSQKFFSGWSSGMGSKLSSINKASIRSAEKNSLLVIDLPESGQAAVKYLKKLRSGRVGVNNSNVVPAKDYFTANVLNSVLGGGYSSRLNQEIRIKRGLSYGAGSNFAWRGDQSSFSASTQTKNESAAEVAELIIAELNRLSTQPIETKELDPRKLVLTGDFSRDLETNDGIARAIADLYSYGLTAAELNKYMENVNAVTGTEIQNFASSNLKGGEILIVGDYAKMKEELAKRFPGQQIKVIRATDLDLSKL